MSDFHRHDAIRKHLDAYEAEGVTLQDELNDIHFQRMRIINNPLIHLRFGTTVGDVFVPEFWERDSIDRIRPVVLHPPGGNHPTHIGGAQSRIPIADQMGSASEAAYPALRACLLTWLDAREARAREALAAWEARDAVAEAVALGVPVSEISSRDVKMTPREITVTVRINLDALVDPAQAPTEVEDAVYQIGQALFETGAEHNMRPDGRPVLPNGNGHHMAQKLAAHARELWMKRVGVTGG